MYKTKYSYSQKPKNNMQQKALPQLTRRKEEVFQLLLDYQNYPTLLAISEKLYISLAAIKKHAGSIYETYQVKNRVQLFVKLKNIG